MYKKSIFTSIILSLSVAFSYFLVFTWTWAFDSSVKISFKLTDTIYLDSSGLNYNKIMFKSTQDLSDYKINSKCRINSKFLYNNGEYYMFDLKILDNKCSSNKFILSNDKREVKAFFRLNLITEFDILSKFIDLDTKTLVRFKNSLDKKIVLYSSYSEYNKQVEENYYTFLKKKRLLNQSIYTKGLIDNIIKSRDEKYIVPVEWYSLPTRNDKIPNAGRPYRGKYTDGIHHSWDIDTSFWEQVISLDDGIIVRVVDDWKWSNFVNLKYSNLSEYDRAQNLDILRWNQVWLKTMKGEVVFYWHLDKVFSDISEGNIVKKWQVLWTIWISWVPDKNYKDYHLDFSIRKNPYIKKNAWKYNFDDYMEWDWLFKWDSKDYILKNQAKYFEW
jgi:hypothetical protein